MSEAPGLKSELLVTSFLFVVSVLVGRTTAGVAASKPIVSSFPFNKNAHTSNPWVTIESDGQGRPEYESRKRPIRSDMYYLLHAHQIRCALDPPRQSNFRVVCLLLLADGSVVVGANDESAPTIGGAICAERAALLAYRTAFTRAPIRCIYIVTDAPEPVPPGTLCREYLCGHPATTLDTPVCLQSADAASTPLILTLRQLYPHPSLHSRRSAPEQLEFGQVRAAEVETALSDFEVPGVLFPDQVRRLLAAARAATAGDDRVALHPVRYGTGLAVRRGDRLEYWSACQQKSLEYGATQDAVCQLLALWMARRHEDRNDRSDPTLSDSRPGSQSQAICLVQVDQFGIPHVPFAAARSMLVEHGLGNVHVIFAALGDEADDALRIRHVSASELCPFVPDFCQERQDGAADGHESTTEELVAGPTGPCSQHE